MAAENVTQFPTSEELDLIRHALPQNDTNDQAYSHDEEMITKSVQRSIVAEGVGSTAVAETVSDSFRVAEVSSTRTNFLWLEITGKCQRECEHCYAESGPKGRQGTMSEEDWKRVIDEGAESGVSMVQFIGGEPTLNPALPELIRHALDRKLAVEVFSNLERVKPEVWEAVSQEGVSLATSYYSTDRVLHDDIVKRRGSYDRTRNNIAEAVKRGVPIRVGVIGVRDTQDMESTVRELYELGIPEENIGIDYLREVGRGVRSKEPNTEQLCGNCADGVLAIMPDGSVQPCVFSRWPDMTVGNVHEQSLGEVLSGGS